MKRINIWHNIETIRATDKAYFMKLVTSDLEKKQLTNKVFSVADAVAMNALPEYWLSFKLAALHVLALVSVAKLFVSQMDLNQFANH